MRHKDEGSHHNNRLSFTCSLFIQYQGMRLEIPPCVHPQLSKMIQQCWDGNPNVRPSFAEITAELEDMLQHLQVTFFLPYVASSYAGQRREMVCALKVAWWKSEYFSGLQGNQPSFQSKGAQESTEIDRITRFSVTLSRIACLKEF